MASLLDMAMLAFAPSEVAAACVLAAVYGTQGSPEPATADAQRQALSRLSGYTLEQLGPCMRALAEIVRRGRASHDGFYVAPQLRELAAAVGGSGALVQLVGAPGKGAVLSPAASDVSCGSCAVGAVAGGGCGGGGGATSAARAVGPVAAGGRRGRLGDLAMAAARKGAVSGGLPGAVGVRQAPLG